MMVHRHETVYFRWPMVVVCVALLVCSGVVYAGGGPSVENCEKKGMIDISCIICETGEYLGMVSIQAEYDPEYGDCMLRYKEARQRCATCYGTTLSETGIKWEYYLGGTKYYGHYPKYCKH
ncbi:MAG: hypothetical protein JXI32_09770 [Deltaproteobacteria bacterium]|nr:hypothetical protein [Deltaproteobacteria bacterium]